MDDTKLRAFIASVRCGSFSKAASQLGYSQSGLTHMMDKLESELGCTLLQRDFKGISLTQQGRELYPKIEKIVEATNSLYASAAEISERTPRNLRIGAFSSISRTILPEILADFKTAYPNITVMLSVGGRDLGAKLLSGELQLAFVDDVSGSGFDWIPLCTRPLVAVLPKDDEHDENEPISLETLAKRQFISSPEQYIESALPTELEGSRLRIDSADDATIISMIASGLGVSVLSELSLHGYEQSVKCVSLSESRECSIGMALRSLRSSPPEVKSFVSFVKKHGGL